MLYHIISKYYLRWNISRESLDTPSGCYSCPSLCPPDQFVANSL